MDRPTHDTTPAGGPHRRNNFNLVRIGLASAVLLSHAYELVDGGRGREPLARLAGAGHTAGSVAVIGFFLLSGYLITQSWDREPRVLPYLAKRTLRIYPAFVVASLASAVVFPALVVSSYPDYLRIVHWGRYGLSLLLLMSPNVPDYFQEPYPFPNGPMWTIAYEFRCYLLVTALGLCGVTGRRQWWLVLAAATATAAVVLGPYVMTRGLPPGVAIAVGGPKEMLTFAAAFLAGGSFYLFRPAVPYNAVTASAAAAVLAVALTHDRLVLPGLLTAGAYLLFWFAAQQGPWLTALRRLPDVSYGLYLYGWPVQKLLLFYLPGLSPLTLFAAAAAIGGTLGYASFRFVERPFLRMKPRPRVKPSSADGDARRAV